MFSNIAGQSECSHGGGFRTGGEGYFYMSESCQFAPSQIEQYAKAIRDVTPPRSVFVMEEATGHAAHGVEAHSRNLGGP